MKKPKIKFNLLDRAIEEISPVRAARRARARMFLSISGASGYKGARTNRRETKSWRYNKNSNANADLLPEVQELRERSRDLTRNNPLAVGAINTVVTNTVGAGLKLQSQPDREILLPILKTEEAIEKWQKDVEREFNNWAESQDCDITRTQNFYGIQSLVMRSVLVSGDCFVIKRFKERNNRRLGTALQILEADRVKNPYSNVNTKSFAGGVEMDKDGAPIAYHVTKNDPKSSINTQNVEHIRLKAFDSNGFRNVLHVFDKTRPGLIRGAPYLAAVIEPLKMLDKYTEAEIMAAVISGTLAMFVKTEDGDGIGDFEPEDEKINDYDLQLGTGTIANLMPGEDIVSFNPGRPNTAYDAFTMSILRQIGVALELPFEVLIKHFTASYSAARGAVMEAWKFFSARRVWLSANLCYPIFEAVISEAVASGALSAPGFFDDEIIRKAYLGAIWVGPPKGQIDELKEINAAEKRVSLGVTTRSEETASITGGDWEKKFPQLKKENEMMKELLPEEETIIEVEEEEEEDKKEEKEKE